MKANELMIGDWVLYEGDSIKQVVGIDTYQGDYVSFGGEFYPCSDFTPIPLTPEILERNGFKINPQGSYSIGRNISIDMFKGRYNANMNTNNPEASSFLYQAGKYVHELQHALRLCGIDKEIEL